MKKFLLMVGLLVPLWTNAQPSPAPAATQEEVNAGTVPNKYVSPKTLGGYTLVTNVPDGTTIVSDENGVISVDAYGLYGAPLVTNWSLGDVVIVGEDPEGITNLQGSKTLTGLNITGTFTGDGSGLTGTYSTNTVFASKSGVPLDGSLSTNTGTSATAAIQAILDTVTNHVYLHYIHDGISLLNNSNSLVVHSNTVFEVMPQCGFFLGNSNNVPMIRNVLNTNYTGKNITVKGGIWQANFVKQGPGFVRRGAAGSATQEPVTGMAFTGTDGLTLRDFELRDGGVWGIFVATISNTVMQNLRIDRWVTNDTYGGDAMHFWGSAYNWTIKDCWSRGNDDQWAFHPAEASILVTDYWDRSCIVSNLTIDGLTVVGSISPVPRTHLCSFGFGGDTQTWWNVVIKNVNYDGDGPYITRHSLLNANSVVLENWRINSRTVSGDSSAVFSFGGVTNVSIKGMNISRVDGPDPLFYVGNCENIILSDIYATFYTNSFENMTNTGASLVVVNGAITNMMMNNIVVKNGEGIFSDISEINAWQTNCGALYLANNVVFNGGRGNWDNVGVTNLFRVNCWPRRAPIVEDHFGDEITAATNSYPFQRTVMVLYRMSSVGTTAGGPSAPTFIIGRDEFEGYSIYNSFTSTNMFELYRTVTVKAMAGEVLYLWTDSPANTGISRIETYEDQ